jgi:phytol kinase
LRLRSNFLSSNRHEKSYVLFFVENMPTFREFVTWFPLFLVWAYACLFCAGYCKQSRGLKTGYTRKIFHFLIFTSSTGIQVLWGLRTLYLFGAATSVVILYAVLRGDGHLLYEAMAREKDAPHRTYYIIAPYLATLLGGVTSNIFFGNAALVGYLVAGLGDAVGEPIGTRFGKHPYRVLSFGGVPSTRSYEGSTAVFLMSLLAIVIAFGVSPDLRFEPRHLFQFPLLALFVAVLEAISPHGWDNAIMQIAPSWCVSFLL